MTLALARQRDVTHARAAGWPLSRRLTLSLATLLVLLALWWLVAHFGWVDPPVPAAPTAGAGTAHHHRRPNGLYGCHPVATPGASLGRILVALAAAAFFGITVGIAMGLSPQCAACWIPSSSSTARCRRSPTCHSW